MRSDFQKLFLHLLIFNFFEFIAPNCRELFYPFAYMRATFLPIGTLGVVSYKIILLQIATSTTTRAILSVDIVAGNSKLVDQL